ncbi:MAG: Hsp20/alpha crystallin family protein [Planctomycetota bacterium]|jgi:HSP20 family protein
MALVPVKKREAERGSLAHIHEEMDDLFRSFFEPWDMPRWGHRHWPVIDIGETDDAFMVKAEVPGCKAEDIDISVHGNVLTISGEKKQEKEQKEKGCYHIERSYGSFRRDLNLASDVDSERIEAMCKDGVLSLKLPKTEKAKPIKVKVKEQ